LAVEDREETRGNGRARYAHTSEESVRLSVPHSKKENSNSFCSGIFTKTYYNIGIVQNKKNNVKKMLFCLQKKKKKTNKKKLSQFIFNLNNLIVMSLIQYIILAHIVANTPIN
jgi:hypothetical protein